MSHIFGIPHELAGISLNPLDWFGGTSTPAPYGLGPGGIPFVGPVQQPNSYGVSTATGGSCAQTCGPKTKRFITTVCPDGTTSTREAKSRKRKRRLASLSDIKDIAALKQVLGGGKALDTWIATRGR